MPFEAPGTFPHPRRHAHRPAAGSQPHGSDERHQSTNFAEPSIKDYDERRAKQLEFWKAQNGRQTGDPAKLAPAVITIANQEPPPRRFIAGADAIGTAEQKVADLKAQIDAHRNPSLAFDRGNGCLNCEGALPQ